MERIDSVAKEMFDKFVSRVNPYAVQTNKGYFVVRKDLTIEDIKEHLLGKKTIGLYTISSEGLVKWGCIDLDELNEEKARFIQTQFSDYDTRLEFSGSKGYHIWVFFKEPVDAVFAYTMLRARMNLIGIKCEVFPKQPKLTAITPLGNLVKLPLGLHRKSNNWSRFL